VIDLAREGRALVISLIYAGFGIALLFIAYRVFDWLTPTDLQKAIFIEKNSAVAITVGLFMLGVAVVIHGALGG
jgi:uncharacterized membrane protein YjfL (UPF0719 family)